MTGPREWLCLCNDESKWKYRTTTKIERPKHVWHGECVYCELDELKRERDELRLWAKEQPDFLANEVRLKNERDALKAERDATLKCLAYSEQDRAVLKYMHKELIALSEKHLAGLSEYSAMLRDACEERDRLRADLIESKKVEDSLALRVDRLRGALERIAEHSENEYAQRIAREALGNCQPKLGDKSE